MWGKKEAEAIPKPATPPPVAPPVEAKKETTPVSSMPTTFRNTEPESKGAATIGKGVKVNGQIYSREDLYVDGEVEGTIELLENKLTIGPSGKVQASVKAREVVILGSVQGNVESHDKLEIRKDARLIGDLKTARIIIEDGAYFKGSIDIVKPEPAKVTTAARQQASPPPVHVPNASVVNTTAAAEVKR